MSLHRRSLMKAAVATGMLAPVPAYAGARRVRLGQSSAASSLPGLGCRAFATAVSNHPLLRTTLRIDIYDSAVLGDDLVMTRGCVNGTVDIALCGSTAVSNLVPSIGLLDTPFLFKDVATARAALDGEVGAGFDSILKASKLTLLGWGENGLRHMTSNRPIRRPEDLAGLKLRVPPSDVELASFRALGADPQPLPFPALYEALRTGQFDAQENPIALIESSNLAKVQKFLSLTAHIYSASAFIASQDLMDDLSPEQQVALAACARVGGAETRKIAEAAERDGRGRLSAAGMTIVEDVDKAAFMAASKANMVALGQKYGADQMVRLMRAGA